MAPVSDSDANRRDSAAVGKDHCTIPLTLQASSEDPRLLNGLQALLRLELITQRQIRLIAREQLCCRVPEIIPPQPSKQAIARSTEQRSEQAAPQRLRSREPVLASQRSEASPVPAPRRWFQSFMDELSVLWLLFLGVFLVVVSSAVLAASQWQNVSAVGQYLILFAYTVAFWGAGLWAGRQANLRLTARMLQRVTLLLVPINFWAIDGFDLWKFPVGWVVGLGAAIALTAILLNLLRPRLNRTHTPKRLALVTVGLSWLHWGWAIAIMPLLASYIGMIGTAIAIVYTDEDAETEPEEKTGTAAATSGDRLGIPSPTLIAIFGALLLAGRALLAAQVPLAQLGLAFGICGAVLAWRSRHTVTYSLWFAVGSGLMILGWLTSLPIDPPWQPVAISVLALGIVAERLKRLRLPFDLTLLFLAGLQSLWLIRRFAPVELRAALVDRIEAIAGSGGMPFAVVGVTIFPYLLLFLVLGERFRRQGESKLVRQANFLCLSLGAGLVVFSLGNDLMRPLNLTLSALTLGWSLRRRNLGQGWPYLTQLLTWGALLSWFGFVFDGVGARGWLALTLLGSLLEWLLSLDLMPGLDWRDRPDSWRLSAWHSGLALSGLAYLLALAEAISDSTLSPGLAPWSLLWWVVPIALLAMVQSDRCPQPDAVRASGILALFLVQPFTLDDAPYRLASFGVTALLMSVHSRLLPTRLTAAATVGFGVAFSFCLAFRGEPELGNGEQWMFALAAIALVLWSLWGSLWGLLWGGLRRQSSPFKQHYAAVTNGWAIALFVPVTLFLLGKVLSFYTVGRWGWMLGSDLQVLSYDYLDAFNTIVPQRFPSSGWVLATAAIAALSMALTLKVARNPLSAYGLALTSELLLSLTIAVVGTTITRHLTELVEGLAIANLIAALLVQTMGESRLNRDEQHATSNVWHSIPLSYALLGGVLGHYPFDALSGLFTMAAAFIGLSIGRRRQSLTPITYIALAGFSVGAYELLIYQLSQASGGSAGDGIVLLGLLGAGLALGNQLFARWLLPYLHLDRPGFRPFTHTHWGIGSLFAAMAIVLRTTGELSQTGGYLWMLTMAVLGTYALLQSRGQAAKSIGTNLRGWGWSDWGLVHLLSAVGYGIHLIFPWPLLLGWAAAIACPVAILLQRFPWRRLGWSPRPGRRWAKLLPIIIVLLTAWDITIQSLLLVAVFYAGLSVAQNKSDKAIRLSYLSVALVDWAMLRIFDQLQLTDGLWYAGLLGATVLYGAQIDPDLNLQSKRELRHGLRCLGSSIVCFTALYQGQVGLGPWEGFGAGLVAIALSFGFILAGIGLRIRAFLYVGTAAFLIQVLLQVWQFIQDESLLLWAIGIVLGLLMIWIAATFEARRSQIIAFMNHWVNELEAWQ